MAMGPMDNELRSRLEHLRKGGIPGTKEEFRLMYEDWADDYDKDILCDFAYKIFKPMTLMFDAAVLNTFTKSRKEDVKIIDVAAGTGLIGLELHKMGYTNLHALDSSQKMLNEARKKNLYNRFFCLPIDDQRITEINTGDYDALICVNGFGNNHILPSALVEMCRIVAKGGLLCFDIREQCMEEWEEKLMELEREGTWKTVTKEILPVEDDDKTNAFVFMLQ